MIRWKYLIPRLILLVILVVFFAFGLEPLTRWAMVHYGSRMLGAKVDVADVDVSLARADIRLRGFQMADPSNVNRNLFEAEQFVLDLDRDALLNRQFVVREGRISGLRFSGLRETSGCWESPPAEQEQQDRGPLDLSWLQGYSDRMREDIEQDLETVRVARELKERWPEEYRQLESRADDLEQRIRRLRDTVEAAKGDGILRNPQLIEQAASDIDTIHREVQALPEEVRRLQKLATRDREAIEVAKQHDVQYLKERFRFDAFDTETLSRYFLPREQAAQVQELLSWIEWARQFVPEKRELAEPQRRRGWKIRFAGMERTPDWLFERLAVDGIATRNGQQLPFRGEVQDLTLQQDLTNRPTTLDIQTGGATPLTIHAMLDRRAGRALDRYQVVCPRLQLGPSMLGNQEQLAFAVSPAKANVQLDLELQGDQLQGQLVYQQDTLELQTVLPQGRLSPRLVQRFDEAASEIKRAKVVVHLAGPLKRPRMHLESDLGQQLASGIRQSIQTELAEHAEQAEARLNALAEQQLAKAQQRVDAKIQELLARLDGPRQEVEQLAQQLPSVRGLAESLDLPGGVRAASFPWPDFLRR